MSHPLYYWMTDNAELFRYAGELACMREGAGRILLSGSASAFLAPLFKTLYPDATIIVASDDSSVLDEVKGMCPDVISECVPLCAFTADHVDIAVSVLAIESLETRELTTYLFSLYDALSEDGNLYISFPQAERPGLYPMNEETSWYDAGVKVKMKRYQAEDVMKALSMIGFELRAAEKDESAELGTIISIHAVKKRV